MRFNTQAVACLAGSTIISGAVVYAGVRLSEPSIIERSIQACAIRNARHWERRQTYRSIRFAEKRIEENPQNESTSSYDKGRYIEAKARLEYYKKVEEPIYLAWRDSILDVAEIAGKDRKKLLEHYEWAYRRKHWKENEKQEGTKEYDYDNWRLHPKHLESDAVISTSVSEPTWIREYCEAHGVKDVKKKRESS